MLLLFKRNDGIGFMILLFVAFVLQLAYIINPPELSELGDFYSCTFGRFNWLRDAYAHSPRIYILVSTVFWLLFSIYFKQVLADEKMIYHRDFIPSIALILLVSALPPFIIFSVAALSACCLFIAFSSILGTPYNKQSRSRYFYIGVFIGIATALYWPAAIMIIAAFFILLGIRLFVLQEIVALFLGMLFPIYLIWALYYVFTGHVFSIGEFSIPLSLPVAIHYKTASQIFALVVIVLIFYGLYISRNRIVDSKLQIIKKWNGVVIFLALSLFVALSSNFFPSNTFVFLLIPFSIILSSALNNNKAKYNTFTFYLLLVVVLSLQWVLRFI